MATDLSFVQFVVDQAQLGNRLSFKKMFGEYALYINGKVVALACDNHLFFKPVMIGNALSSGLPKGSPYPGAKEHILGDALLDEPERLRELLLATEMALPVPKPRNAGKRKSR